MMMITQLQKRQCTTKGALRSLQVQRIMHSICGGRESARVSRVQQMGERGHKKSVNTAQRHGAPRAILKLRVAMMAAEIPTEGNPSRNISRTQGQQTQGVLKDTQAPAYCGWHQYPPGHTGNPWQRLSSGDQREPTQNGQRDYYYKEWPWLGLLYCWRMKCFIKISISILVIVDDWLISWQLKLIQSCT
jgi:hypothetical protein